MYEVKRRMVTVDVDEYLKEYVDVNKFIRYCENCPNHNRIWTCPPFEFDVMARWEKYDVLDVYAEEILEQLSKLNHEELRKEQIIAKILGYESFENFEELAVYPKGYRILSKVPRMPSTIVENLVNSFKSFQHILVAEISDLDNVEGIGEVRAKTIKQTLKKMQEQFAFDNILI